jgi:hypothetical protein
MRCVAVQDADLEDAEILKIEREPSIVRFWLSTASVRDTPTTWREMGPVRVTLTGVSSEVAAYYIGEGVTAPHPDPVMPLHVIATASWENGTLRLGGYRAGEPWYEWSIVSTHGEVIPTGAV